MNITQFKLEQNQLHRTTPRPARIVAGSIGTDAVQIHFETDIWADITATAVFQAGGVEVSVPLPDKIAPCEIPREVMAQAGVALELGVFGVDTTGQIVIPTTYAKVCDAVLSGTNMDAAEGDAPTETIYAQWVSAVAASAAEATQAAHSASESLATVEEAVQNLADVTDLVASLEQDLTDATAAAVSIVEDAATEQIAAVEAAASKAPTLSADENWLIWDMASNAYLDTGVSAHGEAFTYADFTAEQLAALKGEQGEAGATGAQGETGAQGAAFTYNDFTKEQLDALKGEQGEAGATGAQGETGAQGAAFTYEDFTKEQLDALKGEQGEQGEAGATGAQGETGAQGAAFTYEDFTKEQLDALKGEQGEAGATGAQGETGAQGAPFTYEDFTDEQLAVLKGEQGEKGETGEKGEQGEQGASAENGIATYQHQYDADAAVHTLEGEGENGKFKASDAATANAFFINDRRYTAVQGSSNEISLTKGQWYLFLLDDEDATINFNGGGASLNYNLIASATEPENPQEGTIWAVTDIPVGELQIGANAPATKANGSALQTGDVYLQAGGTSYTEMPVSSGLSVPIWSAQQWSSEAEAWLHVEAYARKEDAWKPLMYAMFYDGVDYIGFGDDFNTEKSVRTSYISTNYVDFPAGTPIDVTNLSTVWFLFASFYNGDGFTQTYTVVSGFVGSTFSADTSTNLTTPSPLICSVDVSGMTGLQSVGVRLLARCISGTLTSTAYATPQNVWGV